MAPSPSRLLVAFLYAKQALAVRSSERVLRPMAAICGIHPADRSAADAARPPGPFPGEHVEFGPTSPSLDATAPDACQLRLLQTAAAIHAFELNHNRLPAGLADLVPDYLAKRRLTHFAPMQPLQFQPGGKSVLYSVGPDGKDDEGKIDAATNHWRGDILLPRRR